MEYVPQIDGDALGWFTPTATRIHQLLRERACVLSQAGEWILPHKGIIDRFNERMFIDNSMLKANNELMFVDQGIC